MEDKPVPSFTMMDLAAKLRTELEQSQDGMTITELWEFAALDEDGNQQVSRHMVYQQVRNWVRAKLLQPTRKRIGYAMDGRKTSVPAYRLTEKGWRTWFGSHKQDGDEDDDDHDEDEGQAWEGSMRPE